MLRAAIIVGLLASSIGACGARASGPAWPEQTVSEEDGGESLAPRAPDTVAAALEDSEDEAEDKSDKSDKDKDKPESDQLAPDAEPETPKGTTPVVPEDVITTEDIVIEIED